MIKIALGGRIRKSPYFEATRRYGCKLYTVYNRMYLPLIYKDIVTDYWQLINNVALWDVACERQLEISGPDAAQFAQYLTPRNISNCKVGQGKYVPLVDENGGMLNDPVLLRIEENKFWFSLADYDILLWAKGIAYHSGMDVIITEPDVSPLAIQGPNAEPIMVELFGNWIKDLRYFWFRQTTLHGILMVVCRSGWSKQGGFELFLQDGSRGNELWEIMMEAGRPYDIAPGAPNGIERVESGLLNFGVDMTMDTNPFEVGLDRYVDLEQGAEFVGKEALRHIRTEGIQKKLVGLSIKGNPLPSNQEFLPVYCSGAEPGELKTAVYSPRLETNIGLAMLPIVAAEVGTKVQVNFKHKISEATVVPLPFI
ncbi:MAG: dimethylsulfoniopropionate demethylase [Chloroflexi bacterium]|nr:dimethylsulfoniopropionate demethylase [Chloroflexota bacterium]